MVCTLRGKKRVYIKLSRCLSEVYVPLLQYAYLLLSVPYEYFVSITGILLICSVYLEYDAYFDRLCTVWAILWPIVRHKTLPDGPTSGSWSEIISLGTTRVLRALAVRREYVLRVLSVSRGSVLSILGVLQVFRVSILQVHSCLCSRGPVRLIFSVLSVVGPSQYSQRVSLLIFCKVLASSTAMHSVLGLQIVLEHLPLYL